MKMDVPELIPGLEEFWAPDESVGALQQEVQKLPPRFAASRRLPHEYGVVYRGAFETLADGVCTAVRRNACALRRAKMPVFLSSLTHSHANNGFYERCYYCELPKAVIDEVGHLTDLTHERTVAVIHHFVPSLDALWGITRAGSGGGHAEARKILLKRTAAYVALESDTIPSQWISALEMFSRILVPCDSNAEWLRKAGVTIPVHTVVHPIGLRDPIRHALIQPYKEGAFRFLHVGKWEPRKNQHAVLGAFLQAFTILDPVTLTLKCNAFWRTTGCYPTDAEESIRYWLGNDNVRANGWTGDNVHDKIAVIWDKRYSRQEMVDLYCRHHAYVQSGRAEGFDLCSLDAKCAGLRIVGVGWGGPSQFMGPEDIWINYTEKKAPSKHYEAAPAGTLWPAPTIEQYATALRTAFELKLEKLPAFDVNPYKIDTVGATLRKIVEEMAKEIGVDLAGYEVS